MADIAAASDLKFAMDELAQQFLRDTGHRVRIAYGSSGNFFRQIAQGAPFQLFLSADEDFAHQLSARGLTLDEGALYAIGRIAVVSPRNSVFEPDANLKGLTEALDQGKIRKFAIANPEHAPYGRAAREALQYAGLWDRLQDRLVLGENVSQAAQFAVSGSAQGGLVAYSLALAPQMRERAAYAVLPAEWHRPLRQRMVLTRNANEVARAFYRYLQQAPARAVFKRYGFLLPGEE